MKKRATAILLALVLCLGLLPLTACAAKETAVTPQESQSTELGQPMTTPAAAPNLDSIAYVVGDRANCKMDAAMAEAYIKAIEQAKEEMLEEMETGRTNAWGDTYDKNRDALYVALADIGRDGYPILITAVLDKTGDSPTRPWSSFIEPKYGGLSGPCHLWSYKDGVATPFDNLGSYGLLDGKGVMYDSWTTLGIPSDGPQGGETIYSVTEGEITLAHELRSYTYDYRYDSNYIEDRYAWWYVTDNGADVTREFLEKDQNLFNVQIEGGVIGDGWPSGVAGSYVDTTPADQAIAALRGWAAAPTYKVTLRLDTGDVSVNTAQGQPMTVPQNPVKEGYTFGGWYTDAALTIPWNFNTTVTGDMELYGKWTPLTSTAVTTGRSSQAITVNGKAVELEAYTLAADSNGGDVTFVKLRDVAAVLDGSADQFNVEWRTGAIYVATKSAYTGRNGTELQTITVDDPGYKRNTAPILFDGVTKPLESIVITDVDGGGHTFFKLRDLADAIGFLVEWTPERGIVIETK